MTGAEIEYDKATSFVGVWESIIARMKAEDRVGTAENYQWALNSFLKYVGDVKGFMVGKNVIDKWNDVIQTRTIHSSLFREENVASNHTLVLMK